MNRAACVVLAGGLVLPAAARCQASLNVTQAGLHDRHQGETHAAMCVQGACRAVLPVEIADDLCLLDLHLSAPSAAGEGTVLFATGPCGSSRRATIRGGDEMTTYRLDSLGAAHIRVDVFLQASKSDPDIIYPDEPATVRLDIRAGASR